MDIKYVFSVLGILCVPTLLAVLADWRPIDPLPVTTLSFQSHIPPPHDDCTLYKVIMDQDSLQQYVQYKTQIPDLKEFTLCTWHKFYNHSHDQPLFYYASHGRPKEIYSSVANTVKSSYYVLAVRGQTIYRLNYPIRLHRWYHSCQSWNGRTGEWQVWINSERIGRGFHNLLVGKPIKGGGVAISGQEQRRYGIGFDSFIRPSSLQGEILLVQLYKAALTAGKAYTNHKHHHVHHFHHDDSPGVDDPEGNFGEQQTNEGENQGTEFPFLRNGQLIPTLPVRELSAFRAQEDALKQQNDDISNIGINSQLNILSSSALLGRGSNPYSLQSTRLFKRDQSKLIHSGNSGKRLVRIKKSDNSEEEQSEDAEKTTETSTSKVQVKGNITLKEHISQVKTETANTSHSNDKAVSKRDTETKVEPDEKVQKKRTIELTDPFGYIPGIDLSGLFSGNGYILGGGGLKFDDTENNAEQPFEGEDKQMEPAEWEVRSIMAVCSGCSEDPFRKANILSWRETPKKLYSGALYVPAIPQCHRF